MDPNPQKLKKGMRRKNEITTLHGENPNTIPTETALNC